MAMSAFCTCSGICARVTLTRFSTKSVAIRPLSSSRIRVRVGRLLVGEARRQLEEVVGAGLGGQGDAADHREGEAGDEQSGQHADEEGRTDPGQGLGAHDPGYDGPPLPGLSARVRLVRKTPMVRGWSLVTREL